MSVSSILLNRAIATGDIICFQASIEEQRADNCFVGNNWCFHEACTVGQIPILEYLLTECKVDINVAYNYKSPVSSVITSKKLSTEKQIEIIEFLLQRGHEPLAIHHLHRAIRCGSIGMIRYLFQTISSKIICSELISVALGSNGDAVEVIRTIIEICNFTREHINARDANLDTPLHLSFYCSNQRVTRELLRIGEWLDPYYYIDGERVIDLPDGRGHTPLYLASITDDFEIIELLIQHGSQALGTPAADGLTPFQYACIEENEKMVIFLHALGERWKSEIRWESGIENLSACIEKHKRRYGLGITPTEVMRIKDHIIKLLSVPLNEEYALSVRFRAYFASSLTGRLLTYL